MNNYDNLRQNSAQLTPLIEERSKLLDALFKEIEKDLRKLPQGKLRVTQSRGIERFYHRIPPHDKNGKYIANSNFDTIAKLAQREYLENLLPRISAQIDAVNLLGAKEEDALNVMLSSHSRFVSPIYVPDDKFIRNWLSERYEGLPFREDDDSRYFTASGIRVRSKSEIIAADRLDKFGVPFKYECPIKLGNVTVYPDFLCLNVRLRRLIIYEHFGMMGNESYAAAAIRKLNLYEKNGLRLGIDFIFTMESAENALDIGHVEDVINHYLI